MRASLIDILKGRFDAGIRLLDVPQDEWQLQSIVANLNRLFNIRRGMLAHLPDYGLPDISEVYRDMPDSAAILQQAIREAIAKYEPRLRHVQVTHDRTDALAMRLVFIVSGRLVSNEKVRFQTTFSSMEVANTAAPSKR